MPRRMQFLKHAFGLRYLPPAPAGQAHRILIRLDDHSSQRHKSDLESCRRKAEVDSLSSRSRHRGYLSRQQEIGAPPDLRSPDRSGGVAREQNALTQGARAAGDETSSESPR